MGNTDLIMHQIEAMFTDALQRGQGVKFEVHSSGKRITLKPGTVQMSSSDGSINHVIVKGVDIETGETKVRLRNIREKTVQIL